MNKELIDKVSEITCTDYSDETFLRIRYESMIEDLIYEIEHLQQELEDIKQDVKDNYKRIPYEEMI